MEHALFLIAWGITSVQQLSTNTKSKVTEQSHSNKEMEHPETL